MTGGYSMSPLPAYLRYYIYGIQGFCDEIIFTAVLDFIFKHRSWELKGHSAISSFFIYGTCCFLVERLYVFLYYKHGLTRVVRMPLYLLICYSWEFTTGLILRQFDACPWDYSHYPLNFMGLITLEYAPGWLFLAWMQDVLADYLLRVRVSDIVIEMTVTSKPKISAVKENSDKYSKIENYNGYKNHYE